MEDIVSRLRALNFMGPWSEAADEIERLREALETFANNVKETNEGIDENWSKTIYPLKAENQRLREALRLERQIKDAALALANDLQNQLNRMNGTYGFSVVAALKGEE